MSGIRKSEDRGRAGHGWLDRRHTFSFAAHHDPKFMVFPSLRVITAHRVVAGTAVREERRLDLAAESGATRVLVGLR